VTGLTMDENDYLAHYGILRKSGRYPWGSGGTQEARNKMFLDHVNELRKQGLSEVEIARGFGITTTELRAAKSIAKTAERQAQIGMAQRLKEKGYSNTAIGERMGLNESSVRSLLAPGLKDRTDILETTAAMLRDQVEKKGLIDIGTGVERHIGISQTKLKTAVAMLKEEGYKVHYIKVQQLGTGQFTTIPVLSKPDVPYSEVFRNQDKIRQITDYSEDGGRSFLGLQTPLSISSKRVHVNYAEDGGAAADGVIYVRRGVKDRFSR
jgi:predicted transcriptional regulator